MESLHVHIVDDDEITVHVLRLMMIRSGFAHTVDVSCHGGQALERLASSIDSETVPDVMFVDLNMPVVDGWQLIQAIESRQWSLPPPPVIVLTSSIDPCDIERVKLHPVVLDFLSKPLTREHLSRVQQIIHR